MTHIFPLTPTGGDNDDHDDDNLKENSCLKSSSCVNNKRAHYEESSSHLASSPSPSKKVRLTWVPFLLIIIENRDWMMETILQNRRRRMI